MGVPAFFRWLSKKYPSVIVNCVEQKAYNVDGSKVPVDASQPNPNNVEFDNLYLDMNGIIHPCTHPEDKPAPKNEDEMMVAIFECIDRLFNIVRPRKVLYMAIDGVAPRAKMNQQRSRRFRASKETVEKTREIARIRAELLAKGAVLPPEKPKEEHFDSNCITPGTPFMDRLSQCLHYYIHDRLNTDPGWKGIKVILSDANVPGEGEHKIMDFIRKQRAQPDHDPNTQHVLCGADADLIMLGLATHEPNFTIIREEFKPNQPRPCDICGVLGHEMKDCEGVIDSIPADQSIGLGSEGDFIFVRLCVLREYLERELHMYNLPFKYDFERAVDDWVFMCFFVGNDFLPHLPSLEIREGAIDRLVTLYKECVYKTGGFLTDSGDVNLDRVQMIMSKLGEAEDQIFKKRQETELSFRARDKAKKRRMERGQFNQHRPPNWRQHMGNTQFAPTPLGRQGGAPIHNARQEIYNIRKAGMHSLQQQLGFVPSGTGLQAMLRPENSNHQSGGGGQGRGGGGGGGRGEGQQEQRGTKRKLEEEEEDEFAHDEVRLWEDGFKDRYYESKFDVGADNLEFRYNVALQYVRGLCWVLRYYYQGCASWKWYFPYHYAPFASDFINIAGLSTEFEKGTKPFRPLEQLMGVFPAASCSHVPKPWAKLMSDPMSTIIDFYPEDFKIDLNGKKFAWQGVALLPFVEEERLFKALEPYYDALDDAEKRRNVRGDDRLYVSRENSAYIFIKDLYQKNVSNTEEFQIAFDRMQASILLAEDCVPLNGSLPSPVMGLPVLRDNAVFCVRFRDPVYPDSYIFKAARLSGAKEPHRVLKPGDLDAAASQGWKPQIGMAPAKQRGSLGQAGHRMIQHHQQRDGGRDWGNNQRNNANSGNYAAIPPPMSLDRNQYSNPYSNRNQNYNQSGPQYGSQQNDYQGGGNYNRAGFGSGGGGFGGGGGGGGYHSAGGYRGNQNQGGYNPSSGNSQQNSRGGYNRDNRRDNRDAGGGKYYRGHNRR